jgi:seryl-tRNA synthetase
MAMDVEAENRELKRRVGEQKGSFGFLTRQIQDVHKDLLEFESKTEQRFAKVDERFDGLERKIDSVDRKIDGLTKTLPGIVGDAVREANRERDRKR